MSHPGDIFDSSGNLIGRKDISDREFLAPLLQPKEQERETLIWAETLLARHDAFLQSQTPQNAYAMKDAADGLRAALRTLKESG